MSTQPQLGLGAFAVSGFPFYPFGITADYRFFALHCPVEYVEWEPTLRLV